MGSKIVPGGRYYHGWNVVAACILSQVAVNGIAVNCFSLFLPGWTAEFKVPASQLLLAIGLETLVGSCLAPLVGVWADKYPARWLFGIGLAGNALFCLAVSFVTAPWQILALFGVILPLPIVLSAAVPANSLISRWFVRRLGMAIGLASFGLGVAGVLLPPVVSHLLPEIGWRALWRWDALICGLLVTPLVVLAVRNRPSPERDGSHYLTADATAQSMPAHTTGESALGWKDVLTRRNFWLLLGMVMPLLAVDVSIMHNLAPFAIAHGVSREVAGQLMSVTFTAHLVAALAIGWLSDRVGPRVPFAVLICLAVIGCAVLAGASSFPLLLIGCLIIGAVGSCFTLLPIGIAAEFGAAGFGRAFGCAIFFLPIAVFSSAGFAKVEETTGDYTASLLVMIALMAIPATVLMFYRRKPVERPIPVALAEV